MIHVKWTEHTLEIVGFIDESAKHNFLDFISGLYFKWKWISWRRKTMDYRLLSVLSEGLGKSTHWFRCRKKHGYIISLFLPLSSLSIACTFYLLHSLSILNSRIFKRLYILIGFGSFFTSLLKTGDSITTTAAYSHLDQDSDREAKMKKLDRFIDIGMKLKHLSKTSRTNNGNKKENIAEIKDIAYTLKKVSMTHKIFSFSSTSRDKK